jgi:hypothetical protein
MTMQDMGTMMVGETVISVGGGLAYLTLPDTHFTFRYKNGGNFDTISKQKNDAFDEYGGGFSGSAATPLGWALGMPWIGAVHGYWSSIDDSNHNRRVTTNSSTCAAADIVDTPGLSTVSTSGTLFSHTERDVDSWGVALELTTPNPRPMILPGIMKSTHWGAAFDVRGLDQDLHIKGSTGGVGELFNYKETLDTTYYGGYFTIGGEYSLFSRRSTAAGACARSSICTPACMAPTPTTTATSSAGESAAASSACLMTRSPSSAG